MLTRVLLVITLVLCLAVIDASPTVRIRSFCSRSCSSAAVTNRGRSSYHLCILKCIDSRTKQEGLDKKSFEAAPSNQLLIGDLSFDQLQYIFPNATQQQIYHSLAPLNIAMTTFNINTCPRRAAFLAQVAAETDHLKKLEEDGSGEQYEGKTHLGNVFDGDGFRFKGRGAFRIVGRTSYLLAYRSIGKDAVLWNPSVVATPEYAFLVAGWYWNDAELYSWADENTPTSFDRITKVFTQHQYHILEQRQELWRRTKLLLGC